MNTSSLLNQLLQKGTEMLNQPAQGGSGLHSALSGKGAAALGGGALGLLLGNKKARKMGGKVAVYGGLAALGVMAYKALSHSQQQQQSPVSSSPNLMHEPQTLDRLPEPDVEVHSQAILKAIICAAKADGHIDDQEREMIDKALEQMGADAAVVRWVDAELKKPVDPSELARVASTPEMAAEMYLASLMVIDEQNYMERVYLKELASQLQLSPQVVAHLEQQVSAAQA